VFLLGFWVGETTGFCAESITLTGDTVFLKPKWNKKEYLFIGGRATIMAKIMAIPGYKMRINKQSGQQGVSNHLTFDYGSFQSPLSLYTTS
jgi:hypothetical protein